MTPDEFIAHPKARRYIQRIEKDTGLPAFKVRQGIREGKLLYPSDWSYHRDYWEVATDLHFRRKGYQNVRTFERVDDYLEHICSNTRIGRVRGAAMAACGQLPLIKEPYTQRWLYHPDHWTSERCRVSRPGTTLTSMFYAKLKANPTLFDITLHDTMNRKRYWLATLWAHERLEAQYPGQYDMADVRNLFHDMLTDPKVASYRTSAMAGILRKMQNEPRHIKWDHWYAAVWRNQLVQYARYQFRQKSRQNGVIRDATRQLPVSRQKGQQLVATSYDQIRKTISDAGGSEFLAHLSHKRRSPQHIAWAVRWLQSRLHRMENGLTRCWIGAYLGNLQALE